MQVKYSYLDRQFPKKGDLTRRILRRIEDVALRGDFTLGKEVEQFEDAWCEVVGSKYAVGVSNGTDAIKLGLLATGGKQASPISIPANTFVGTANAAADAGRTVEFVDVDDETMNLDSAPPARFALPVAWCGLVPQHQAWSGDRRRSYENSYVPVLDGAQAIGATFNGEPLTKSWPVVTYSLHPLKNINVWGDGGVLTTDDPDIADKVRLLRNHGLEGRDHWIEYGYNHRLSTLQAAVGLEVLKEFPYMWERRHQIAYQYHEALKESAFRPAQPYSDTEHAYHVFQIRVDIKRRDDLLREFQDEGVEVKVHYPIPLHKQLASRREPHLPNVERQAKEIITLPMHEYLTDDEVGHVCQTIKKLGS